MRNCLQCDGGLSSTLTKRKNAYVFQCKNCFSQIGTPIKKQDALKISSNIPMFVESDSGNVLKQDESESFYFKSEPELCKWFIKQFSEWFFIFTEVQGVHTSEKVNLRIDFILYPKQSLIDQGFDESFFGVEVKHFLPSQGHGHKLSRAIWQTASYNDTIFDLQSSKFFPRKIVKDKLPKQVKLNYSLLFSNISFKSEYLTYFDLKNDLDRNQSEQEWRGMLLVANHANVGTIRINTVDYSNINRWEFLFASSLYFTYTKKAANQFKLNNLNLVIKKRTGNF
ncbi:hypothetical protein GNP79_12075 [Aliivibrio fischeri]|uniref:Uncharacterized protein n=1 Tax=Aliivibrio fischeri TaxID=668 RepID=A0A6N3Z584_ALIFS|nr:hypothetical protein [Aliivibrio fischeri]MUK47527.1 hypothetical protein [Aliivibrio fischeri]MUK81530.1 hypothetical protein [Aliivibrio fischeri]MUK82984.1 hypothetical protein [Aliivibrio fischeri]